MKRFFGAKTPDSRPKSQPFKSMRNMVEDRHYPAVPEQRILPKNRSEIAHAAGDQVKIGNYDPKANTFDLSVVPTSMAAHTIDKALTAASYKMRAEAEERRVSYDNAAENAVMRRFDSPVRDMRKEAYWARYEARPANPVLFSGHGVEMILTGLSELINAGERREAQLRDLAFYSDKPITPYEPDVSMATDDALAAKEVLLAIGRQINAEHEGERVNVDQYLGGVALGPETVDLTGQVEPVQPVNVEKV
jgi:hypothetical protein